ncbi:MAG: CoA pyrophosphatase [Bacteroidales bacterium]|jgi:8-oxo-dGTP pyrophosphatase MutT (NUDIX family)|nr:CoA pyrophosphatase [Bacteroidales bacterium]
MDRSVLSLKFKNFSRVEAVRCAENMLSDFQHMHFARYYANPFPLRKSAVMILLFVREGRLKTIMIERTNIGVHAGQISFPGGKSEPSDTDSVCTAIRETEEEIGILVNRSDIIGELPSVKVPVSKFEIFPVVAFVENLGDFVCSENEVKRVIEVDLEDLKASFSIRPATVAGKQYEVPSFLCGNSVIWGATAMIVAELFSVMGTTNV